MNMTKHIATFAITLFAAFFTWWLTWPEEALLVTKMRWVEVENPTFRIDEEKANIAAAYRLLWGEGAEAVADYGRYQPRLRLIDLEIKNSSTLRSKQLEIGGDSSDTLFSSNRLTEESRPFSNAITIRPLDPEQTARVFAVQTSFSSFFPPKVPLIHDNRLVKVDDYVIDDGFSMFGFLSYGIRNPYVGVFMEIAIFLFAIFIALLIPAQIFSYVFPSKVTDKLSRIYTDSDLERMCRTLIQLDHEQPERISRIKEKAKARYQADYGSSDLPAEISAS